MRVNDQVTFSILDAMKNLDEVEDCNPINVVDVVVIEKLNSCCSKKKINATTFEELKEEDVATVYIAWLGEKQPARHDKPFESLDFSNNEVKPFVPSIKSPPILELKLLSSHLKYIYLGENNTLSIIISSSLNAYQKKSLVDMLRRYKRLLDGPWQI